MKYNKILAIVLFAVSVLTANAKDDKWQMLTATRDDSIIKAAYSDIPSEDRYYSGDYICSKGDEHNAPTCFKNTDYIVIKPAVIHFTLEDGRVFDFIEPRYPCFLDNCSIWSEADKIITVSHNKYPITLRYRLGKVKNGMQKIELETPEDTSFCQIIKESAPEYTKHYCKPGILTGYLPQYTPSIKP